MKFSNIATPALLLASAASGQKTEQKATLAPDAINSILGNISQATGSINPTAPDLFCTLLGLDASQICLEAIQYPSEEAMRRCSLAELEFAGSCHSMSEMDCTTAEKLVSIVCRENEDNGKNKSSADCDIAYGNAKKVCEGDSGETDHTDHTDHTDQNGDITDFDQCDLATLNEELTCNTYGESSLECMQSKLYQQIACNEDDLAPLPVPTEDDCEKATNRWTTSGCYIASLGATCLDQIPVRCQDNFLMYSDACDVDLPHCIPQLPSYPPQYYPPSSGGGSGSPSGELNAGHHPTRPDSNSNNNTKSIDGKHFIGAMFGAVGFCGLVALCVKAHHSSGAHTMRAEPQPTNENDNDKITVPDLVDIPFNSGQKIPNNNIEAFEVTKIRDLLADDNPSELLILKKSVQTYDGLKTWLSTDRAKNRDAVSRLPILFLNKEEYDNLSQEDKDRIQAGESIIREEGEGADLERIEYVVPVRLASKDVIEPSESDIDEESIGEDPDLETGIELPELTKSEFESESSGSSESDDDSETSRLEEGRASETDESQDASVASDRSNASP